MSSVVAKDVKCFFKSAEAVAVGRMVSAGDGRLPP